MGANAVLSRELRVALRNERAFAIIAIYVALLGAIVAAQFPADVAVALSTQSGGGSAQLGHNLFKWFAWSQALLIALLLPSLATGAIAQERERRTLEPLLLSPLTPLQIVWGKAVGVLAFACLLLLATVPLTSLCFLLGGVSPGDVIGAYTCLLGLAGCVTALGLGCSAKWQNTTQATLMCYVLMPFGFAVLLLGSVPGAIAGILNVMWWSLSAVANWWKKPHRWLSTRLSAFWKALTWPVLGVLLIVMLWLLSTTWGYGLPWLVVVLPYCALVSRWTMKWAADEIARRPEPRRPTRERVNDLREEWAQAVAPPPVVTLPSPTGKYTYSPQTPVATTAKASAPTYSPSRFLPDGRNPVFMRDLRGGLLGKWSYLFRYSYVVIILSEIASPFFASLFDGRSDGWQPLVSTHLMLLLTAGAVFGARALAPEREQQTLPQLLTTPLLPREIVWGKIMAVGVYTFYVWMMAVPLALWLVLLGVVSVPTLLVFLVMELVFGMFAMSWGVWCRCALLQCDAPWVGPWAAWRL
jgi:ABC-type transport system involved in multi-copper enzyme maturation permease subunit